MSDYKTNDYKIFELFRKQWALVTAGTVDNYNSCTVSWGSMGTIWTRPANTDGSIITVYIHPARYTLDFMKNSDTFTVSFFSEDYHNALGYMGSHSGRNEDKAANAGLTPVAINNSTTFKEATTTFVCRKLYQHQFAKEDIHQDIQNHYIGKPQSFPPDEDGNWQPHWMFIGEIIEVQEN